LTGIARLETFTELKALIENPHYQVQRQKSLGDLTNDKKDPLKMVGMAIMENILPRISNGNIILYAKPGKEGF